MARDNRNDRQDDSEKLRAEAAVLLEQARNQLADIQRALSSLGDDRAAHGRLAAAADRLSAVVSELSQAVNSGVFPLRAADLAAIGSIVQSGEAHAALAEASSPMATSVTLAANVATASAETRTETESLARDVFDRHIFEPYLRFRSAEDEAEFRKRQAADKKYVDEQLARHTPEGDLNASGGMIDSMLDLHAHGAGNSPQFTPRYNAIVEKAQRQHDAMRAAGQPTAEYDRNLDSSLRHFLKAEGHLTNAEIEKRLKGVANPLDVVKPYLDNSPGADPAKRKDQHADAMGGDAADIGARLKAAGVTASDKSDADATPKHGVNVQKIAAKDGATLSA